MKFLLCAFLVVLSCQVILCEEDIFIVRMANKIVPQIIRDGVAKGDLPGGPYYIHHVIKSSIGAQNTHLTLDVRRLDHQTNVTLKVTVDNNDFSVKSSCMTSKIGENIMALSQGWGFAWQDLALNGQDLEFCGTSIYDTLYDFEQVYELTAENLVLDGIVKSAYQDILDAKTGRFAYIMESLDPAFPEGPPSLYSSGDYIMITQKMGTHYGQQEEEYFFTLYQPCSGDRYMFHDVKSLVS